MDRGIWRRHRNQIERVHTAQIQDNLSTEIIKNGKKKKKIKLLEERW